MLKQNIILHETPLLFCFCWVQMIEPSFTTLFRGSQILFIGLNEKSLSYFVPFCLLIFGDDIVKSKVFFIIPFCISSLLIEESPSLILEQIWFFNIKYFLKKAPILISLNKLFLTREDKFF